MVKSLLKLTRRNQNSRVYLVLRRGDPSLESLRARPFCSKGHARTTSQNLGPVQLIRIEV
jgi:hypothetical protein